MATVVEDRDGLHVVDGTIYAACRSLVGDRRYMSSGLDLHGTRQRADGVLEVTDAELLEVSMVHTPRWREHCAAHVWDKAG